MRIIARSVWNLLVFLLNSLVFILIGIQLSGIVGRLAGYSAAELVLYGTLVSAVAIAVRFAWIYPATYLPRMLSATAARARARAARGGALHHELVRHARHRVARGGAGAAPRARGRRRRFPQRDLIIFLTFVVIAVTLVRAGPDAARR